MEKAYNLFLLFDDEEISIQNGYNRYATEKAYFLVLDRFTIESDMILEQCQPERYNSGNIDIVTLMRNTVKLEGLLLNIGAAVLALRIQSLNILLDNKEYDEYLMRFCNILIDVERLRERIINAEKSNNKMNTVVDRLKTKKSTRKIILAIDDKPDVLRKIQSTLRDKYNVFCMTNYDSAVRFLRRITIDLILFDIEMVGYHGLSMMHLFKNLPKYAKMPVIFLTGSESNEHVRAMINLGADDFVEKPVDFPVLINKLERVLM